MTDFHRKVELQTPEDLQYLVANARRAAKEYLDKDFPPDLREEEGGGDSLHAKIERNVDEYIMATFQTAAPNLTINGLDVSPSLLNSIFSSSSSSSTSAQALEIQEHEPFNARLFERAKQLAKEEEDLIEEIARLRRTVPGKVVQQRRDTFGGLENDENVLAEMEEKMKRSVEGEDGLEVALAGGAGNGGMDEERRRKMEENWEGAVRGVAELMRGLPEVVARKERAEEVERYVLESARG